MTGTLSAARSQVNCIPYRIARTMERYELVCSYAHFTFVHKCHVIVVSRYAWYTWRVHAIDLLTGPS